MSPCAPQLPGSRSSCSRKRCVCGRLAAGIQSFSPCLNTSTPIKSSSRLSLQYHSSPLLIFLALVCSFHKCYHPLYRATLWISHCVRGSVFVLVTMPMCCIRCVWYGCSRTIEALVHRQHRSRSLYRQCLPSADSGRRAWSRLAEGHVRGIHRAPLPAGAPDRQLQGAAARVARPCPPRDFRVSCGGEQCQRGQRGYEWRRAYGAEYRHLGTTQRVRTLIRYVIL